MLKCNMCCGLYVEQPGPKRDQHTANLRVVLRDPLCLQWYLMKCRGGFEAKNSIFPDYIPAILAHKILMSSGKEQYC